MQLRTYVPVVWPMARAALFQSSLCTEINSPGSCLPYPSASDCLVFCTRQHFYSSNPIYFLMCDKVITIFISYICI